LSSRVISYLLESKTSKLFLMTQKHFLLIN